jgi:hypothetical protein
MGYNTLNRSPALGLGNLENMRQKQRLNKNQKANTKYSTHLTLDSNLNNATSITGGT